MHRAKPLVIQVAEAQCKPQARLRLDTTSLSLTRSMATRASNAGKQRGLGPTQKQLHAGSSGQSNAANGAQEGSADMRELELTPAALQTYLELAAWLVII